MNLPYIILLKPRYMPAGPLSFRVLLTTSLALILVVASCCIVLVYSMGYVMQISTTPLRAPARRALPLCLGYRGGEGEWI